MNPYSQQQAYNQSMMSNYNQAYVQNTQLIGKMNFENQHNMIHNNVSDNVLNEYVMEYSIKIDSRDRNRRAFQSPFNMRVLYGNSSEPTPLIERKFENVKYITLDSVILPRTLALDVGQIPDLYPTESIYGTNVATSSDVMHTLKNHPYLILMTDNIEGSSFVGTSRNLQKDRFTLLYDSDLGIDSTLWKPVHSTIVYPNSSLFNLNRMPLVLCDEYGIELRLYDESGTDIMNVDFGGIGYTEYVENNGGVKSIRHTDRATQVVYNFTVGVVQNEISTVTKSYK